ncbi:uncharacterized protein TNCV_3941 [Trichonephila clavipes]|nr:uncharacterized protein TNCV_3941 [Trichonephila clavipes]
MSKRCGECEQTKFALEEDSAEFRIWYEGHQDVCSATHVGSSGEMEVNAVKLWERSESIGFRYTTLLSDGDSKSFLELKERNVYGSETQIKKEECINHVNIRLGTALRQLVKDWRVKGVTLGGDIGDVTDFQNNPWSESSSFGAGWRYWKVHWKIQTCITSVTGAVIVRRGVWDHYGEIGIVSGTPIREQNVLDTVWRNPSISVQDSCCCHGPTV